MILGLTGTGKSTLVNYLNEFPLVCVKRKMKWILELETLNLSFPGGFSIAKIENSGHSQTFLPASFTPQHEDFTYIDDPGFKDTNGLLPRANNVPCKRVKIFAACN